MSVLLKRLLPALCLLLPVSVSATEDLYTIFSAGFADSEFDVTSVDGGSYKLAVGYQFERQWYLELGYQQLADESFATVLPTTEADVEAFQGGMQGDALFAALLGKASGSMGELFYRIGILNADVKGQSLVAGETCNVGSGAGITLSGGQPYTLCEYDEGNLAGVIGIGFDFYAGTHTMVRLEVEHIQGENDLTTNAVYLGFRYNFW